MAVHTFTITGWHPVKLNKLLGSHWAKAGRLKKFDRDLIAISAINSGIPKAKSKRRVSIHLTLKKGQRAGDPDAYWKSLLDGLVKCGLLVDDNRQWSETSPPTFGRGEREETQITLEDMP